MTQSIFSRRTEVQVFQVDHGSVIDGILHGHNAAMPDASENRRRQRSNSGNSAPHSPGSMMSASDHSRSTRRTSTKTNKAKLGLSQEDKKRLVVGSDLCSKKKRTSRTSAVKHGIQQYFKKSP